SPTAAPAPATDALPLHDALPIFAHASRISASLSADALNRGDVILDDVRVSEPVVALRESGGGWNFEQVFEELLSGGNGNGGRAGDRKSTRLNSSHVKISYAVFCL